VSEFQAAVLGRVDMVIAYAVIASSVMVLLLGILAVRALWSR
jgi:hypothetical protein